MGSFGQIMLSKTSNSLLAYTAAHKFDVIMHVGDFAYNLDTNNGQNGLNFMANVQAIAARIPYMVLPGNHE